MGHELVSIDEVSFQLATNYKKIWFPKGQKPKGAFFWSNKKLLVIRALTSSHKFYYEFHIAQNSLTFMSFLSGLFDWLNTNKKYVLILDNAGRHKTNCVKNFIAKHQNIQVEYLPPYLPELNPIETNWKATKKAVTKSQFFNTIENMQEALINFWEEHFLCKNL